MTNAHVKSYFLQLRLSHVLLQHVFNYINSSVIVIINFIRNWQWEVNSAGEISRKKKSFEALRNGWFQRRVKIIDKRLFYKHGH